MWDRADTRPRSGAYMQRTHAEVMMGDRGRSTEVGPGLSRSLERCQFRHSHLRASQGGVGEAEQAFGRQAPASRETVRYQLLGLSVKQAVGSCR